MNFFQILFNKQRAKLEMITGTRVLFVLQIFACLILVAIFAYAFKKSPIQEAPLQGEMGDHTAKNFTVGLLIEEVPKFRLDLNEFIIVGTVWFEYVDAEIAPSDFDNFQFQRGEFIDRSKPQVTMHGERTRVTYNFSTKLQNTTNIALYPFDSHRIDLVMVNYFGGDDRVLAKENIALSLATTTISRGWSVTKSEARSFIRLTDRKGEIPHAASINRPVIAFSIYVERDSPKTAIVILLPLILIFFIGLVSLTFDVTKYFNPILSLAVGSLTGFLLLRGVMDKIMPPTDEFTVADKFYLLLILLTTLILGIQIYVLHFHSKLASQTQLEQLLERASHNVNILRGCFFIFFTLLFLVTTAMVLI